MTDKQCNTILRERIEELSWDIGREQRLPEDLRNPYYIDFLQKAQDYYRLLIKENHD